MDDSFQTIANPVKVETKVTGSRFMAETRPIENVKDAGKFLQSIRKREHAASHHCYGYRAGIGDSAESKYSDDGEPNGTAGKPIYDCITGRMLTNVLVVVTRYFGGTKLGTGGLARSYSAAAAWALDKSGVKTVYLTDQLSLQVGIKYYEPILKVIAKYEAGQKSTEFSDIVKLSVAVRKSQTKKFIEAVTNLTNGQIKVSL